MKLPFGLNAWYPLVHGNLPNARVFGQDGPATLPELEAAWQDAEPGQALVIVDRIQGSLVKGLIGRSLRRSVGASLAQRWSGEGQIEHWLVLPSTGGSHVLLPASQAGFRAGAPLLPAGRRCWRVAGRVLRMASGMGLSNHLGFDSLVVAVKGAGPSTPLCPWLAARGESCVAVSLGVPGSLRKATLRVCDPSGQVVGFLKVAMGVAANKRIEHEADTLRRLRSMKLGVSLGPQLFDSGSHGGHSWLVQAPLDGPRSVPEIQDMHVHFLAQLAKRTGTQLAAQELPLMLRSREQLDSLAGAVDAEWLASMNHLHSTLRAALGSRRLPCALSHGDFTPWNLSQEGRRLAAFDWEFAEWQAPLLADLVHFHLQTGILVRRVGADQLLSELVALLNGAALRLLVDHNLSLEDGLALIGLEVLRAATADEALNQVQRPGFAQVDWLRQTRRDLSVRIAAHLERRAVENQLEACAA